MNTEVLRKEDCQYPQRLINLLGEKAPVPLYYRGDISILKNRLLGFVCSIQCPGNIIIKALDDRRLLILSIFHDEITRKTEEQAVKRNNFVAALSEQLWVPHVSPAGKTWATVHEVIGRGQTVYTFDVEENRKLIEAGALDTANIS